MIVGRDPVEKEGRVSMELTDLPAHVWHGTMDDIVKKVLLFFYVNI
jgi:hypothetical protein